MEAKDVMNLPWKGITDWSELPAVWIADKGDYCVTVEDIDVYIENIFRDIARQLKIPYETLLPILKDENHAFYSLKEQMFQNDLIYGVTGSRLTDLKRLLRVPDISNIKEIDTADNVSCCLEMFEKLSDVEKIEFLQKIGKINVTINVEQYQ